MLILPSVLMPNKKMRCWRGPFGGPSPKKKGGGEDLTQPFCFRYASCIRRASVLLLTGMLISHARACSTFPTRPKKKDEVVTHKWRNKWRMTNRDISTSDAFGTSMSLCNFTGVSTLATRSSCAFVLCNCPLCLVALGTTTHCGRITKLIYFFT